MATKMMLQCVLEGSISMHDMEVEHRPYHRNCSCAMHKVKGSCSNACPQQMNISFPKKQPQTSHWINTMEQRRLECTVSCKVVEFRELNTAEQEKNRGNHGTKACHSLSFLPESYKGKGREAGIKYGLTVKLATKDGDAAETDWGCQLQGSHWH
ncbi:hypothetical protein M0R45_003047 [Rubus argutus]|uniref:Uncharacterized protein n=1 Tax=Rubus argutus TaxID=59490 RepID=A0AAW1YG91_RUBAR